MRNSDIRTGFGGRRRRSGNLMLGIILLIVGSLLFAREFGADLPSWLFRWEVIVIIVGILIGLKSGFRDFGWIAISAVGFFFLSDDIFPGWNATRFIAPVAVLAVGAFILLNRLSPSRQTGPTGPAYEPGSETPSVATGEGMERPQPAVETDRPVNVGQYDRGPAQQRPDAMPGGVPNQPNTDYGADQRYGHRPPNDQYNYRSEMEEEQLDIVSVFSAVNRKVFSKNFVGGEIVCVFGGSEVNFMNADIAAGTVELEVVCIFGGATLFIPPNWHVRSEMGSVFGGVDDKRKNPMPDHSRTLIIKGVCIFGGLEIKSKYQ